MLFYSLALTILASSDIKSNTYTCRISDEIIKHMQLRSNPDQKLTIFWLCVISIAHQENFYKNRMNLKFKLNNKSLIHKWDH